MVKLSKEVGLYPNGDATSKVNTIVLQDATHKLHTGPVSQTTFPDYQHIQQQSLPRGGEGCDNDDNTLARHSGNEHCLVDLNKHMLLVATASNLFHA